MKLFEKLVLAGILFEMKLKNNTKVHVSAVYDRFKYFYHKVMDVTEVCPITFEEFATMIYNMAKIQIIAFSDSTVINFMNSYISIKFYVDEFTAAVSDEDRFKEIIKEI